MQSRISINIHGQNVPDVDDLLAFLDATRPAWLLVMDNVGLAKTIKARLPETNVIYRHWGADGDENDAQQYSAAQWVAEHQMLIGEADLWCYTTNEPSSDDKTLAWSTEVVNLAAKAGLKVVIGNWAVGNPTDVDHDWPRAKALLEALDAHRQTAVMGLHEYACGVITSGLIGGTPEERGLILPETWPEDVSKLTQWHCGRFNFAVKYCESVGIQPPRIVITEHGFDDLDDMKAWTKTLKVLPVEGNAGNIRGWQTLGDQWYQWFWVEAGLWLPQKAYFEQLKYADQKIYQGSPVEGQLIYCWGHSSPQWIQFDVAGAETLQAHLKVYADVPHPLPPLPQGEGEKYPLPPAVEDARWVYRLTQPGGNFRVMLRENPTENSKQLAQVGAAEIVAVIPDLTLQYGDWRPVLYREQVGWMNTNYVRFVMGEEADKPSPPVSPPLTPPHSDEEGKATLHPPASGEGNKPVQFTEKQLADIIAALEKWIGVAEDLVEAFKVCAIPGATGDTKSG